MKIKGKMSISSRKWLDRQSRDIYVKRAHIDGYKSRAAYKLLEMEEKFSLIKKSKKILDLGAAPGGWSKVVSEINSDAKIVSVDLLNFDDIPGVDKIIGDFNEIDVHQKILEKLGGLADLILSDMAPSTIGHAKTDHLRIMNICLEVAEFAFDYLSHGGNLIIKIFHGSQEREFTKMLKEKFQNVSFFKPNASRKDSVEIYVVCTNFVGVIN